MATFQALRANAATLTITLASLATSATRVVGRESTAINETSNLYLGQLLSVGVTTGTTPTASFIDIWVYGSRDEVPNYPDVLDGTDSAETFADENSRNSAMHLVHTIANDTTSDQTYWMAIRDIAPYFGGWLPAFWGVFIAHSTGVNLNATAGNHEVKTTGMKQSSV